MLENVNRLKRAINKLSEAEAKSMLFFALLNDKPSEELQRLILQETEEHMDARTIHIVFGHSPAGSLKAAFKDTEYGKTEEVIVLPHNLSIGPLKDIHKVSGVEARLAWFQQRYNVEDDGLEHYAAQLITAFEKIRNISPQQHIVIWTCQNAPEQTGLRLVLALLEGKGNTVRVIDTFKAFHEQHMQPPLEDYPRTSGEVNAENLLYFYEQGEMNHLTYETRKILSKEGSFLLSDDVHILRTWTDHKLVHSANENRDDNFIIGCAQRMCEEDGKVEYKKSARLIGEVMGHMQQYTGDEWIEYRLRALIKQGVFSYRGDLKAMRFYEVKLADDFLTNVRF
ncbi:DUF1835 domain-containing protein [Lysinibacillus sp. 38-6]|uniref:DUF1835 domain-containing protein n=1 Tax=Lysinibacillus sp. 38-6 TaxID=3385991 RepID=UPI0039088CBB